ncbi:GGDEF domain-containing protein [Psychrobacter sp. P11G5]|uniref:GGDEF domain-containing protein n=1 Tax=Psychrobacter sp. P11G5 TaxID=1699624 RepID=UPI0009EDE441|nr:GGDEF domain-containing protein [Psychrobacter sp. P11G5]
MVTSIYRLGYKKLSQMIFEWQAADRASLLALFIVMEVTMHWLWCLLVWLRQDAFGSYVDMALLYPIWVTITLMGLFFWWMVGHLSHIKNDYKRLHNWQIVLIFVYSLYIAVVVLVMGHSSLVSGVSLVGGTMLAMMLVRRRYIWYAFLIQVFLIVLVAILPYLGVNLPSMRQLTITSLPLGTYSYQTYTEMTNMENAIAATIFQDGTLSWDSINEIRRSSVFFWRATHMYLALPKAIFMVYVFSTLLLILDNSKKEIIQHANHDELTGLKNRRYGLTQMRQTLADLTDTQDYTVILLDLDLFKYINDNYGHEVGDQVLKEVANILMDTLADIDIVSRYGGEEFLIILPDMAHDLAMTIAEQLRCDIANHVIQVNHSLSFSITASLGLYTLTHTERTCIKQRYASIKSTEHAPQLTKSQIVKSRRGKRVTKQAPELPKAQLPSDICQRLIRIADKALYEAKDRGRNQVVSANEMLAAENSNIEPLYCT